MASTLVHPGGATIGSYGSWEGGFLVDMVAANCRPGVKPNDVELASGKVAELVKSFEHVTEILDGFRYQMGTIRLIQCVLGPLEPTNATGLVP